MLLRCILTVDSCPATDISLNRGRFEQKLFAKTLVCGFSCSTSTIKHTHTAVIESYCEAELYGIFFFILKELYAFA